MTHTYSSVDEYCALEADNCSTRENLDSSYVKKDATEFSDEIFSNKHSTSDAKNTECRHFMSGGRNTYLTRCDLCNISSIFSCSRAITSLAPTPQIGCASYELFEEIASYFSSGLFEDHILHSVNHFIEGKSVGRDSINFLSLVGVPSFKENGFPGCTRHPNIGPILGMMKSSSLISLVVPKTPYTLENVLHYSPSFIKSDWHVRFIIYQLLSALCYMHGLGIAHGNLHPENILLTDTSWCWVQLGKKQLLKSKITNEAYKHSYGDFCFEGCSSHALYADLHLSQSDNWQSSFHKWWKGEMSNFEYLLILNRLAGRRWGDHTFYTVMPWVIDFSTKPDVNIDSGWRDLSKSKWRLAKGDEQLDFTYSTSEIPHHVSEECLSELAVCSYKARRLPLSVLRIAVRSVYEPNEYPSNMQRLYQWTPDECIPEFYCDPSIFYSLHQGMPNLAVPSWAATPEAFIKMHRDALESNRVSCQLHQWIDITFGYKMSGDAAVAAKNVMLTSSTSKLPRSTGRRQLFTQPHPPRHIITKETCKENTHQTETIYFEDKNALYTGMSHLSKLEEAISFCDNSWNLTPNYIVHASAHLKSNHHKEDHLIDTSENVPSRETECGTECKRTTIIDSSDVLDKFEVDDDSIGYQELLLWRQTSSSEISSESTANDIFSIGCILAELELGKPLFDHDSLDSYLEDGVLPSSVHDLPHHMRVIVEACIQKEWNRKPSAKCLLESPYFPNSIKSSYVFLAPFHLLAKEESHLQYAATITKQGALKMMGAFGAEMCASYCLRLVVNSGSDTEADLGYVVLTEFLKCLKLEAVIKLVLPSIQKILQAIEDSHLKVSLLQGSFMQEMWNRVGKQEYLEMIHPLIISNLNNAHQKSSTSAASVLLVGSSEELGVPVTVHQTIIPLLLSFGKGLSNDGVDALVRIGTLYGENFIMKQIIPLLHSIIETCISASFVHNAEPIQSWASLALVDCLTALDGLVPSMSTETIVKELIEEKNCPYVQILMQKDIGICLLQKAAKSLVRVCQQIGPDSTVFYVLPKLKELFDEIAFSQKNSDSVDLVGGLLKTKLNAVEEDSIVNRMDLALLLYPEFASLLGIEKLRHCCATWLLLEQFLLRHHNWKWVHTGDFVQYSSESMNGRRSTYNRASTSENVPAHFSPNGVGWSRPQSQGKKGSKSFLPSKVMSEHHQNLADRHGASLNLEMQEPWYWFPSPAAGLNGVDFSARAGGPKDDLPWKIRATVIQSIRAHHGALRSFAVCQNECTVFTAGVGPGFKGSIQKWELSRVNSILGYNGHDEVVNDICVLASSARVASCDGTVHIWNGQTGKFISVFSETSSGSTQFIERDLDHVLNFNPLPGGILSTAFHGNSYTTMNYLEFSDKLLVGTGNGSLRFIDVNQGQKLQLWRSESIDSGFPPLVSSICSSSSAEVNPDETATFPSWIATALSTGYCRLFDMRSGKIIASWQAHDGYVTKLVAANNQQLVSSSLDKTLKIWDLRRNWTAEQTVFRGYSSGVSGFSVWGQNVISVCRNRIGLSSLNSSPDEDGQYSVTPQHLYTADGESKNMSALTAISILPFSRLFLVGTEDGHLKICC
ncbi:protein GFS12 isoform X2 [Andrographis paniculata]|uniref:protein GFS12 isoform X2 n=1 Tax=Andrographis paniculata TaxID=175694 RepID=UPI0021E88A3A|nr:protein GFS12 isoform X2 [Andrographis paniculata]